ncbi:MAG: hypothetical protein P8Q40_00175 [Candidatus Poseidonia sp.]|uniref:HEAT repeat domain-containing protein n=1 Tax=Poseidonia sp. TaxID=2666344 RepID=UPI0030C10CDB|nr:hypothetical protein [Poseidonia sp.]MDG1552003.1 hypothetical protein [Poseidonia sp.]
MSKIRKNISNEAFELVATGLVEALERGTVAWPLPSPPMSDPDFPAIPPTSPHVLFEQGLGILNVDRGMFDRHLNSVVDLIVPHRMNLSDDPFEIHERWLKRRMSDVSNRLLFCIATDWLAQAFDPHAPNTDRWWLSIALLNGLSTVPHGQPVHQGYHLVESIALAERPGTWHTQPDAGPQHMDWNPTAVVPRMSTVVVAHTQGVEAAVWLLERLENSASPRRLLLMQWVRLLMERKPLIDPLGLKEILLRRAADEDPEIAAQVTLCLAKSVEADRDFGLELTHRLHSREEPLVQRGLADVLTRLFRRLGEDAIPFLNDMLESDDESVLAAASSTVGDLKYLDKDEWADRLATLAHHPLAIVRRNLVPNLREYIEFDSTDRRGLLHQLWCDGDEVVRTRLRELLIRMEEVDSDQFAQRITGLNEQKSDLEPLWEILSLRRPERCDSWKAWLSEGGPHPTTIQRSLPQSTMEDPGELPELGDALDVLDQELGFLD